MTVYTQKPAQLVALHFETIDQIDCLYLIPPLFNNKINCCLHRAFFFSFWTKNPSTNTQCSGGDDLALMLKGLYVNILEHTILRVCVACFLLLKQKHAALSDNTKTLKANTLFYISYYAFLCIYACFGLPLTMLTITLTHYYTRVAQVIFNSYQHQIQHYTKKTLKTTQIYS